MIARFLILLDRPMHTSISDSLSSLEISRGRYRIVIYPPLTSQLEIDPDSRFYSSFRKLEMLTPSEHPNIREDFEIDGSPANEGALIQIDFVSDDFHRLEPVPGEPQKTDPPLDFVFSTLNDILLAIRLLSKSDDVKPMTAHSLWRLLYLGDNAEMVQGEPGKVREVCGGAERRRICAITPELWNRIPEALNLEPPPWLQLLLDAYSLRPDFGPALILATTALEVLIWRVARDKAIEQEVSPETLAWINEEGDKRRYPSLEQRYDSVLKAIMGRSLREEPILWQAFKEMIVARNNFAHSGSLVDRNRQTISEGMAGRLLERADEIIKWVEALMPEGYGSRSFALKGVSLSFSCLIKDEDDSDRAAVHHVESEIHPKVKSR